MSIQSKLSEIRENIPKVYDAGYGNGYDAGYKDGDGASYAKGYNDGEATGHAAGYLDGMDAIVNQTVTSYSNDTMTKMAVAFFQGNVYLETIRLSALTHVSSFLGCTSLKNVYLPNGQYIQSGVFKNCSALEVLDFPKAEQIHSTTFENCTKLKTLILRWSRVVSLGNTNSFLNTPIANGLGYIYVPDNLVESYKIATNWATYASQFRAVEDYTKDGTLSGEFDFEKANGGV